MVTGPIATTRSPFPVPYGWFTMAYSEQLKIGDVVVCPSVAASQASEHAGSVEDELVLLVVHGGLHLAGWDHASDPDRVAMWDRERDLVTTLYGAPARDPWGEQPS